jgi:predicted ATPase
LSWVLWILGYPDQAIGTSEKAIAIARRLSQPFALAMALFFACATRACCGQRPSVRLLLDELAALTSEHRMGYLGSCARVLEAQELIAEGHCVEGLQQVKRAFAEFRAQEAGVGLPWAMSISAAAHARLQNADEGLVTLAAAFDAAARNGEHHWEAELWRSKGELLLLPPARNETEAETCFRRAIDIAQQQAARSLELRATTSLARLLASKDDGQLARRMLAEACELFTEGADTADIRGARSALQNLNRLPT